MPIYLKVYLLFILIVILYYVYLKWVYVPLNKSKLITNQILNKIVLPFYIYALLIIVAFLWGMGIIAFEIVHA